MITMTEEPGRIEVWSSQDRMTAIIWLPTSAIDNHAVELRIAKPNKFNCWWRNKVMMTIGEAKRLAHLWTVLFWEAQ